MNISLYQAGAALNANTRWQEIIAENLSSGNVAGYKKKQLSLAAVQAGLMPSTLTGNQAPQSFVIPKTVVTTNFSDGQLDPTGSPTDFALEGRGFFEVQLPGGVTGYTRGGAFQVNSKGQLTTTEGYPVMSPTGPIQLNPHDTTPVTVSADGNVTQGAVSRGKLALVDFKTPDLLTQVSSSYFIAQNPGLRPLPASCKVRQGYLEGSNSSPSLEMANLMTVSRGFETNQHIIQIQDDRMSKTINDLGNTA